MMLIKLLLAHLIGYFLLRPGRWEERMRSQKLKSGYLYLHLVIYGSVAYLLTQSASAAAIIFLIHAVLEMGKQQWQHPGNRRNWFFLDQVLHLVAIGLIAGWSSGLALSTAAAWLMDRLPLVTGLVFLTVPSSVIIRHAISRWDPDPGDDSPDSLEKAGAYIGVLERLFVFTFVLIGQWGAIGFLIAAKSVFRFGDLKEAHDRKLTEYILIGTLMSVGMAAAVGALVRRYGS